MIERFVDEDVKTRLILSGITELEERGVKDFSLRRAAQLAGVSCAAPYRYFKSKEDYIIRIFEYLASKWELLSAEVIKSFPDEPKRQIIELCMANLRFWLANRNLRSVIFAFGGENCIIKITDFNSSLCNSVSAFYKSLGLEDFEASVKTNALHATLIGYVTLIGNGELADSADIIKSIYSEIGKMLEV